jgi:hypothetical protein
MKVKVLIEFEADALIKGGTVNPKDVETIISDNVDIIELCESDDIFINPNQDSFQVSIDELKNESN